MASGIIGGIPVPLDADAVNLTGPTAGGGDLGRMAAAITAEQAIADARLAALESRAVVAFAGSVATFADLPGSPTDGQTFVVRDEVALYTWNGTDWEGPVPVQGTATEAAVAAVVGKPSVWAALTTPGTRPVGKGELVVAAADHGVVADGATDSRAAMQAVVDTMPATGGTILLPPGTIALSGTILLPPYVRIEGRGGRGSVLRLTTDAPAFARAGSTRHDMVGLAHLRIQRTSATSTQPLIDLTGISYGHLVGLDLQDIPAGSTAVGVLLDGTCYYNHLEGVQIRGAATGVLVRNHANRNTLTSVAAIGCGDGFVLDDVNSNRLVAVSGESLSGDGVRVQNDALSNVVLGAAVEDVGGACYRVRPEGAGLEPLHNVFAFCYASPHGGLDYDMRYYNFRIDQTTLGALAMKPATERTFIRAIRTSSSQPSIPAATWTRVEYNAASDDVLSEVSGPKVTVKTAGYYQVDCSALFDTSAAGVVVEVAIHVNGTAVRVFPASVSVAGSRTSAAGGGLVKLAAGDQVEVYARSSQSVAIISGGTATWLCMTRLP